MRTTQTQTKTTPQPDAAPTRFSPPKRVYKVSTPAAEVPDLATQLQRERVLGHSFSKVRVQAQGLKPRDPGRRLPDPLQHKMEAAFGQDFSSVRVHEDGNAESIGASAYTRGEHVHFKPGAYQPQSRSGQSLLGHELTHVVQQRAGRVALPQGKGLPINADGELEGEADAMGRRAANGQSAMVRGVSTGVQRKAVVGGGGVVQCEGVEEEERREEPVEERREEPVEERREEPVEERREEPVEERREEPVEERREEPVEERREEPVEERREDPVEEERREEPVEERREEPVEEERREEPVEEERREEPVEEERREESVRPSERVSERHSSLLRRSGSDLEEEDISSGELGEHSSLLGRRRGPNGWQRFKRWLSRPSKGETLVSAHSPGIYTGPVTAAGIASNAGLLTEAARHGVTRKGFNPDTVNKLSNNPPQWMQNAGKASTIAAGAGDVTAMTRTAYNVHKARQVLNDPHADRSEKALAKSHVKSGAADLTTQSMDMGAQSANLISTFAPHGGALATHASQAAPFLSVPVSGVVGARAVRRAHRAGKHERALGRLLAKDQEEGEGLQEGGTMRAAAEFTRGKMKSRKRRQIVGATGAALGVAGGVALGLGALGVAASMLTPIGWGLAAAGGAVALGIGAYKLGRWAWKKYKKKNLGRDREQHAANIHEAINEEGHPDQEEAHRLLRARSIDPEDVKGRKGREFLKEKMESW